MSCSEHQERVSLFIDGELEPRQQVELFQHLAGCEECQSFIDTMLRLKEVRQHENILYPTEIDDTVLAMLTNHRSSPPQGFNVLGEFFRRHISIPVPVVTGLVIAAILVGFFMHSFIFKSTPSTILPASINQLTSQPGAVIVIYGVPPVEVHSTPIVQSARHIEGIQN
jgi:hypothetical protein